MNDTTYKLIVFDLEKPLTHEYAVKRTITKAQFDVLNRAMQFMLDFDEKFCSVERVCNFITRDATGYTGFVILDVRYKARPIEPVSTQLQLF